MKKNFNKNIFKKKKKQKYPRNKFFSYHSMSRHNKNFSFKDFRNSSTIHSKFIECLFYGTCFEKCNIKYTSFSGSKFKAIDFINCNFKGCFFKGVIFEHCTFKNCKFEKANFAGAIFINCFSKGTNFKKSKKLSKDFKLDHKPVNKNDEFLKYIQHKYKEYNIIRHLTPYNINRLSLSFSEAEIEGGLQLLLNKNLKYLQFSHLMIFTERFKNSLTEI